METLSTYKDFNSVNGKLLNYVEYNRVNENEEEENEKDEVGDKIVNEILEQFKKLSLSEKKNLVKELEESMSKES